MALAFMGYEGANVTLGTVMLNGIALGMLWGAVLGEFLNLNATDFLRARMFSLAVASVLFLITIFWPNHLRNVRAVLATAMGLCWTAIHSPQSTQITHKTFEVIWSDGCGDADGGLIISNFDRIYYAKGAASKGDLVVFDQRGFGLQPKPISKTGMVSHSGQICEVSQSLRGWLTKRVLRFPKDISSWLMGFVLGRKADLDTAITKAFKNIGLLHTLVLSGGHLSVVAGFSVALPRMILILFYVFRVIPVRIFVFFALLINVGATVMVFVYCLIVGFSPSIQRAFMVLFTVNILPMIGFPSTLKTRVKLSFVLQALFFPIHILSLSAILSWTCSLLLLAFSESMFLKDAIEKSFHIVLVQLLFLVMSLLFFGTVGVLSPVANVLGLLIFGFLLPFDIFAMFFGSDSLDALAIQLNRATISWVLWMDYIQSLLPRSFLEIPKEWTLDRPFGRLIVVAAISMFYLLTGLKNNPRSWNRSFHPKQQA